MMLLYFYLGQGMLFGQTTISGVVKDAESDKGLPFVHISINNGETGTVADLDGKFDWTATVEVRNLRFSYVGYFSFRVDVDSLSDLSDLVIKLERNPVEFQEVVVHAGENPAHRLIRGVFEKRDKHRPENYPSFRYLSYNKMWVSVDFDSTLRVEALTQPDTSDLNVAMKFFRSQHIFMSESVVERTFRRPSRSREEILATQTSGFENPYFILIGTELQSFSFYESEFQLAGVSYKSPISRHSERFYEFHMRDTILHEQPTDTTYVVAYYPVKGRNFPALEGLLYIRVPDFALENVIAEPAFRQEANALSSNMPEPVNLDISIRQQYRKVNNEHWFPTQLNTDFSLNMFQMDPDLKGSDLVLNVRTYLDSIEVGLATEGNRMGPVDVLLNKEAGQRDDHFWDNYRHTPLDSVDLQTYKILDSLGQEYKFDERFDLIVNLFSGRLSLGMVDLKINRLLRVNVFEGLRLGAGFRTNHNFSSAIQIGGWYGYGFRDKNHKLGGDVVWVMSEDYQLKWILGFERELEETAGSSYFFRKSRGWMDNNWRSFFLTNYHLSNQWYSGVEFHPRANLKSRLSFHIDHRELFEDYRFVIDGDTESVSEFQLSYFRFDASFAPGDRYFQGVRGRQNLNHTFPRFYLSYQHGLQGLYKGEFDFSRVSASMLWAHSMPAFGRISAELTGGALFGENLPYFLLFSGRYNFVDRRGFFNRIIASDNSSFETMRPGEFHSEHYLMLLLRCDFSSLLFSPDVKNTPHLEVVLRTLWGDLNIDESLHSGVDPEAPSRGYFESGVEVNRIYDALGLGVYYRMGPYSLPTFSKNLAIRLTTKFVF